MIQARVIKGTIEPSSPPSSPTTTSLMQIQNPNLLPGYAQNQSGIDTDAQFPSTEALKRRLNARMEYAKFLQDTVKEQVGVQTQSWGYANQRKEHSFLRGWTNFLSIEDLFSG
ncbi:hypothetical protein Rs2_40839 [Raphanus sativus]|nr:hypothetical protein Rs2_40839 [Raphanus sativus]